MTLSTKIKKVMKNYTFPNGEDLTFGSIIVEIGESDYPVNANSWNESDCKKVLDGLVSNWLKTNAIIKREK